MMYRIKYKATDNLPTREVLRASVKSSVKDEYVDKILENIQPEHQVRFKRDIEIVKEFYAKQDIVLQNMDHHTFTTKDYIDGYPDLTQNEWFSWEYVIADSRVVELRLDRNDKEVTKYIHDGANHYIFTVAEMKLFDTLGYNVGEYRTEQTGESMEDWYDGEPLPQLLETSNVWLSQDGSYYEIATKQYSLPIGYKVQFKYNGQLMTGVIVEQFESLNYKVKVV